MGWLNASVSDVKNINKNKMRFMCILRMGFGFVKEIPLYVCTRVFSMIRAKDYVKIFICPITAIEPMSKLTVKFLPFNDVNSK